jgi:chemotaxis protein MotB
MPSRHATPQHHHDEEESYFVSMTDMMVGMLFVFIIMLMSFALNFRDAQNTQETIMDALTGANTARAAMLADIQQSLEKAGIQVKIDQENGILRLPEDILFDSAQAVLKPEGLGKMQILADTLARVLPCYAANGPEGQNDDKKSSCRSLHQLEAVFIEGHTDDVPLAGGRFRDNWELSAARSINTYRFLVNHSDVLAALANERHEKLLSVSGYGEFRPVASNDTATGRTANRRIDLRFLMETPKSRAVTAIQQDMVREKTP